jgi:hypothetical protein
MISEESNRAGSNVLLIASIYDGNLEPGLTLKRLPRDELRFQDSTDRRKVLFHRLFKKSPLSPSPEIDAMIPWANGLMDHWTYENQNWNTVG